MAANQPPASRPTPRPDSTGPELLEWLADEDARLTGYAHERYGFGGVLDRGVAIWPGGEILSREDAEIRFRARFNLDVENRTRDFDS